MQQWICFPPASIVPATKKTLIDKRVTREWVSEAMGLPAVVAPSGLLHWFSKYGSPGQEHLLTPGHTPDLPGGF